MRKMMIGAASALTLVGAASAAEIKVIDFEDQTAGAVIDNEYTTSDGVTVSATGGSGDAMVFDTNNVTGGDTDLAANFDTLTMGGTDNFNPGNILIISEDGDSSDPDDAAGGGTITFTFDRLVSFVDINIFDVDVGELVTVIFGFEDGSRGEVDISGADIGNGNYIEFTRTFEEVFGTTLANLFRRPIEITSLGIRFSGSGGVDGLQYSEIPLPAALPLMLVGLGGLGWASRRKKAV